MSGVRRFRKKPVEIEAMRATYESIDEVEQWVEASGTETSASGCGGFYIHTLEGDMLASIGDWIIRGVQGEFYPCKPDIFAQTYDEVDT